MKFYRRIVAALAVLILCFSMSASAWAADAAEATAEQKYKMDVEGKSWDEIFDTLLSDFNTSRDNVSAAYVNLVSGEEHYVNPDTYMVAASMYKLPLNMYYTKIINSGEFDWDANYPNLKYEAVRDESIINSDNDLSIFLWEIMGGYTQFRKLTAEFMGCNFEDLSLEHVVDNMYTARQFAECLKLLYNEQDSFPGMIETMQKAEPERFFKLSEPRFNIAHKFGIYSKVIEEVTHSYMNDCGIAFTTEPIALVMFTHNVADPEGLLTAYASTMCDYTEHLIAKAAATPEPTATPEPSPIAEPEPVEKPFPFVSIVAIAFFVVLSLVLCISLCIKHRIRFFWLLIAIIISAAAMLMCVVGMHTGTIYAKPSGDPQQLAVEFMDSICSSNYDRAYELLRDYSDLGLENQPTTVAAQKAYEALHQSFNYELAGECSIDKLTAKQPVTFTYLDLTAIEGAVAEETPRQLKIIVDSHSMSEIYDANRNYLPEVTEEAYLNAVTAVLKNAESYYKSINLQLELNYSGGEWQVLASPALLRALNGGAGY